MATATEEAGAPSASRKLHDQQTRREEEAFTASVRRDDASLCRIISWRHRRRLRLLFLFASSPFPFTLVSGLLHSLCVTVTSECSRMTRGKSRCLPRERLLSSRFDDLQLWDKNGVVCHGRGTARLEAHMLAKFSPSLTIEGRSAKAEAKNREGSWEDKSGRCDSALCSDCRL